MSKFAKISFDHRDSAVRVRRFWVWWNDTAVRVAVKPGETLMLSEGSRTEEGFYRQETTYRVNVGRHTVETETWRRERDCDGLHEGISKSECHWHDLEAEFPTAETPPWIPAMPKWRRLGRDGEPKND
jgi:hypothetical protein